MERKIFPFLKNYNKDHKLKLSFNDIVQEINNVKIGELKIGQGVRSLTYPDLNLLQEAVFHLFDVNPKYMISSN
jgi:hypothetical protein